MGKINIDPRPAADNLVQVVMAFKADCVLYQESLEVSYLMIRNILA